MDEPGARLDLSCDAPGGSRDASGGQAESGAEQTGRFLGIHFECCGVYGRIYPNADGSAYEGRCPRCLAAVRVGIGPDGGTSRFFAAR